MLTKIAPAFLSVTLVLASTGCGYLVGDQGVFRDRSEDYKKSPEVPPVTVPEGMDSVSLRDIYVIPEVDDNFLPQGEFEVPKPVPLSATSGAETVRIQKLGDQSWALIGVAPGQVWPQVRNFMAASGMQVARADAKAGIIDTNWLTVEGEPLASRFRFRIEQGVQRGTSELHVLQMRQSGQQDASWPATSDDPAQAAEMLRSISQFIADSADSTPVSMVAEQGISAGGKISMEDTPDGSAILRLELPFDRAWASLGRALQESSFEITDKDRSSGLYYVRFDGEAAEEEAGWWASLWNSDDAQPLLDQVFIVSMVSASEQAVTIAVRPQDSGIPFDKREAQELLSMIKGNID